MAARLESTEWSTPARVARGGVLAPVVGAPVLELTGRWAELVISLRAPAAWNAAHTLTIRARSRGAAPVALVASLDAIDWRSLDDGTIEASIALANRPCDGFTIEIERGAALADPGAATLEAHASPPGSGSAPTAERADLAFAPRALPQIAIVAMGYDAAGGVLRPLGVDASGALEVAS